MIVNVLIFIVSLAVIASKGLAGLEYILAAVCFSYGVAKMTPKHRWLMWVSVVLNGLMLVIHKFQGLWGNDLIAMMGLSYFTLQIIAYNVDVYKGKYPPEKKPADFAKRKQMQPLPKHP